MSMTLTEADALVAVVAEFAATEIAPRVAEYDPEEALPRDLLDEMGPLGFFGGVVPETGGLGLDFLTFVRVVEEISKTCQIIGIVSMPSGLVGAGLVPLRYTRAAGALAASHWPRARSSAPPA